VKLTYFNSGETVESFESYAEDGTEPCTVSMNVVEGSTYLVSLIESHDFSLMNYTLEIDTAQVSEIKFPETFVSLNVKQSYQLQPTVLPENAVDRSVAYTSTNKKVATVDANGMVYAKGVGKASIICTAADSGGANSVVKVTVTSPLQTQSAKINVLTSQVSGKAKIFIAKSQYASGYEIQYSLNKSMKKSSVATSKSTTATIKKLTAGKKYYFRVRAYTVDGNGKKIYSKYSSIKSVKIKR
jgi:hypothetical protein